MNFDLPTQVTARLLAEAGSPGSPEKVPFEMSGELLFPGGVSAGFYCSFQTENQQWANVSGTRGLVHVPDFVLPFYGDEVAFEVVNSVFDVQGCEFHMQRRSRSIVVPEYSNSHPTAQEARLFRTFSSLVTTGRLDRRWGEIALATQRVMDACVESAGAGRTVDLGG
jgi:predicted dehydrogenase